MNTDPLASKFAAVRATTTITGPGGPQARATVRRQRRRTAITALAALAVLVLLGGFSTFLTPEPDRLTPATSTEAPDGWQEAIRNARIDLAGHSQANCAGPTVQFTDGAARIRYDGNDWNYTIGEGEPISADIDRDGRPDYIVPIGCKAIYPEQPCPHSPDVCERRQAALPLYIGQVFVLTGDDPDDLTAIDGIRAYSQRRDEPYPVHLTVSEDGLITVSDDDDPSSTNKWRYRDGQMVTVSR